MTNKIHFSLFIVASVFFYVVALPRLNLPINKPKNVTEHGAKTDAQQQQQMPSRSAHNLPSLAQGPPPDYVQEASEKARIEYWKIFTEDKGQTPKGELKAMRLKWAECNGMKEEYEMYEAEHEQKTEAFHKLMISNLGGDALRAIKKIWEITHNDDLSRNAECQQAQDVLDGLKTRVRSMLPLLPYGISGIGPAPECLPIAFTHIL
uniref:SXP/RAL-2 family protein Ani s 5-like cation-binding domain-containing protein n=1 Tax=Globodera rostochiensis TaxID=31243 RepID=A0A914I7S5_GLORO